jgi:hypothetical protein
MHRTSRRHGRRLFCFWNAGNTLSGYCFRLGSRQHRQSPIVPGMMWAIGRRSNAGCRPRHLAGKNIFLNPTATWRLVSELTRIISLISAEELAGGFSIQTCTPARRESMASFGYGGRPVSSTFVTMKTTSNSDDRDLFIALALTEPFSTAG